MSITEAPRTRAPSVITAARPISSSASYSACHVATGSSFWRWADDLTNSERRSMHCTPTST